jgi:chemotaxis protein MotC
VNHPARIALGLLLCMLPVAAHAEDEQAQEAIKTDRNAALPVEMVRTLQVLQDQIALGSTDAHVAQRTLLGHIEQRLMPLEPDVWRDSRNVRAAVIFVLSGGRPGILKRLLSLGIVTPQDEPIVQGALAYVEGRETDAKGHLSNVDLQGLPPGLAGQIALVQSALVVRDDPAKSVQLLDAVRLQLPGTLIEEAALRRAIFVVSQIGDLDKFERLSKQYLRRFRSSVYSGNFRQRFAAALAQLEFARDHRRFQRLVAILDELEAEGQRELYLLIARMAIDRGQTEAAILSSEKAYRLSSDDKVSAERSKLYKAAAVIVTAEGFESGVGELRKIDRAILSPNDVALLDSALSMASHIRSAPEVTAALKPEAAAESAEPVPSDPPSQAISRAQEALEKVDRLFRR